MEFELLFLRNWEIFGEVDLSEKIRNVNLKGQSVLLLLTYKTNENTQGWEINAWIDFVYLVFQEGEMQRNMCYKNLNLKKMRDQNRCSWAIVTCYSVFTKNQLSNQSDYYGLKIQRWMCSTVSVQGLCAIRRKYLNLNLTSTSCGSWVEPSAFRQLSVNSFRIPFPASSPLTSQ